MIATFATGTGGNANYVRNGKEDKPRDKDKVFFIDGNFELTELIAKQSKSGEYYTIVVSVEKKLSNEEMTEIYHKFKKELLVGLKEDEYAIAAAIHQDTDYTHLHIMIPKNNLLTGQHLQLYMHGVDTERMDLICDYIALQHNLKTKEESKPTIKKDTSLHFEKQREVMGQEPFTFKWKDKKEKAIIIQKILNLVTDNIDDINSLDDIELLIHSKTDLKVVNRNFDRTKQNHYITIQNTDDKKAKILGKMFGADFFKQSKTEQKQQLTLNTKSFSKIEREVKFKQVKKNLKLAREDRFKKARNAGKALKLQLRLEQRNQRNKIKKELKNEPSRADNQGYSTSENKSTTKPIEENYAERNRIIEENRITRDIELSNINKIGREQTELLNTIESDITEQQKFKSKLINEIGGFSNSREQRRKLLNTIESDITEQQGYMSKIIEDFGGFIGKVGGFIEKVGIIIKKTSQVIKKEKRKR